MWRVNDVTPETTIAELRQRLSTEHNANLSDDTRQPLTLEPNPKGDQDPLPLESTLQSLGLGHGDMVHLKLDESIRDMAHEVSRSPAVDCGHGHDTRLNFTFLQHAFVLLSSLGGFPEVMP